MNYSIHIYIYNLVLTADILMYIFHYIDFLYLLKTRSWFPVIVILFVYAFQWKLVHDRIYGNTGKDKNLSIFTKQFELLRF